MNRLLRSIAAAGRGIRMAVESQRNMQLHFAAAVMVISTSFYFNISAQDWCMVIFAMALVITAELMNTAIEGLVDILEPHQRPLAGRTKDIAAGGVLIAAACALGIGLLVFSKYFTA